MAIGTEFEASCKFYEENYEEIRQWFLKPGNKVILGDRNNQVCRFCGKLSPEVTFNSAAHAIPEAMGNKTLFTAYECDTCNQGFGTGIENDFGNWSKPMRTFAQIVGKNGVPTIKTKKGDSRIELGPNGFDIKQYETDPILEIDEEKKTVTFRLRRDPYTPVAVLKAFVKMGLSLLPEEEMPNFRTALSWIRNSNHQVSLVAKCPMMYTFVPGPRPFDIVLILLRRKRDDFRVPYATFVLAYGNEVLQVFLPSPERDHHINHQQITIRPFPNPYDVIPSEFGPLKHGLIDLTGLSVVRDDITTLVMKAGLILKR